MTRLQRTLHVLRVMCNDHAMHNEELITAKDKALELGISRATLTRRVQAGTITPAFRADGDNGVMLFTPETPAETSPEVVSAGASGDAA